MAFPSVCLMVLVIVAGGMLFSSVESQICKPPGQLCQTSVDCCRGCCEQFTCVERSFSCNADLVAQPGSSSCINYRCPPHQICYLREVCPPENPCPRLPFCKHVFLPKNQTKPEHNGSPISTALNVGVTSFCIAIAGFVLILHIY